MPRPAAAYTNIWNDIRVGLSQDRGLMVDFKVDIAGDQQQDSGGDRLATGGGNATGFSRGNISGGGLGSVIRSGSNRRQTC